MKIAEMRSVYRYLEPERMGQLSSGQLLVTSPGVDHRLTHRRLDRKHT